MSEIECDCCGTEGDYPSRIICDACLQSAKGKAECCIKTQTENEQFRKALKEIAATVCYHPTERTCPKIAEQALKEE